MTGGRGTGVREAELRPASAASGIAAVNRLKAGDNPVDVLDDRFVDAYSISGNIDDYLAGVARFAQAGVTELVVTFVGHNPVDDIQYLGDVLKGQKR